MKDFLALALVQGAIIFTILFVIIAARDYLNGPLVLALALIATTSVLRLIDRFVVELMSDEEWTAGFIAGTVIVIALVVWGLGLV